MDLRHLDSLALVVPARRFDSLSAFVQNELLQIVPTLYNRKFAALEAERFIPIESNINPGAMSWAFNSYDQRGEARFIGANAKDIPRADVSKEQTPLPIRTIVSSYGWTLEEIESSRFANTSLDVRKGEAARRAIAELSNTTLLFGSAARGLPGFLNNPKVPIMTVPNGDWLGAATADTLVADLNAMVDKIYVGTKRIHRATQILLPNAHYRKVQTARLSNTSTTALQFFQGTNPGISVDPLNELDTAGPSSAPRAVAYEKDSMNLGGVIPLGFQQLDPQVDGFETVIPARERVGGTVWYYPFAGAYVDGLGS